MKNVVNILLLLLTGILFNDSLLSQQDFQINKLSTLSGHTKPVFAVVFSPDSKILASASYDKSVMIWDVMSGKLQKTLTGHTDAVFAVTFNPGGTLLASGGKDGRVILWSPETGKQVLSILVNDCILCLKFDPAGAKIAVGGKSGAIVLFEVKTGKKINEMKGHSAWVSALDFSPDGEYLATAGYDSFLKLWNPSTGKLVKDISESGISINALCFAPDGKNLITGGSDNKMRIQEVPTGSLLHTLESGSGEIVSIARNSDGTLLTGALSDGSIGIWEVSSGKILRTLPSGQSQLNYVAFSPDGKMIATAGGDNTIGVWQISKKITPPPVAEVPNKPPVITILSPAEGIIKTRTIQLHVKITDDKRLVNLIVTHNGNQIFYETLDGQSRDLTDRGISIKPRNGTVADSKTEVMIDRSISLSPGNNAIEIIAFDGEFTVPKKIRVTYVEPIQRWAVVIGISDYKNTSIPRLRYADRDAQAFYDFLKTPQGGGFPDNHIRLLLNDQATSQNLRDAVNVFLGQAIEEDLVYIYFAGHGAPEAGRPQNNYLLTYEADPERLPSTAFPMYEIETALERHINANKVIMIADACHSGAIGGGIGTRNMAQSAQDNLINQYLEKLMEAKPGRLIFTASEAGEPSQESEKWGGGHGVFTHFLLEALQGKADVDNNGVITLGEVLDYTDEMVRRETHSRQHPIRAGLFDRNMVMSVMR